MAVVSPAGEGGQGLPDLPWVCFQSEQVGAVSSPEDWDKIWDNWRPLTMAGIFDCWEPPAGGDCLYSYSIITVDSCRVMSDIHNRQATRPRLRSEGLRAGVVVFGFKQAAFGIQSFCMRRFRESETEPDSQDAGTVCVRLTRHPSLEAATLCKSAVKPREPTEKWDKGTALKHFVSDPVKKMTGI